MIDEIRALAATEVSNRSQGLEVVDSVHGLTAAARLDADGQYPASLLKGSVAMFCLLLSQALHRSPSEEECLDLYRRCMEYFFAFCDAAGAKVDEDLFALDTRSRHLKEKLAPTG
jgi:hypothetical protein